MVLCHMLEKNIGYCSRIRCFETLSEKLVNGATRAEFIGNKITGKFVKPKQCLIRIRKVFHQKNCCSTRRIRINTKRVNTSFIKMEL